MKTEITVILRVGFADGSQSEMLKGSKLVELFVLNISSWKGRAILLNVFVQQSWPFTSPSLPLARHRTSQFLRSTWNRDTEACLVLTLVWRRPSRKCGQFGVLSLCLRNFPSATAALPVGKGNTWEGVPLAGLLVSCPLRKEVGQKEPKIIHCPGVGFSFYSWAIAHFNRAGQKDRRVGWKRVFVLVLATQA